MDLRVPVRVPVPVRVHSLVTFSRDPSKAREEQSVSVCEAYQCSTSLLYGSKIPTPLFFTEAQDSMRRLFRGGAQGHAAATSMMRRASAANLRTACVRACALQPPLPSAMARLPAFGCSITPSHRAYRHCSLDPAFGLAITPHHRAHRHCFLDLAFGCVITPLHRAHRHCFLDGSWSTTR